jgi:hypothetical protein
MPAAPATSHNGELEHLRVIVYRDGDLYMAQGIEVDIATQAKDISSLLRRLDLTIEAECAMSKERGGAPFQGIGAAPNYFHGLWDKRSVQLKHLLFPVGHHFQSVEGSGHRGNCLTIKSSGIGFLPVICFMKKAMCSRLHWSRRLRAHSGSIMRAP